MPTVKLSTQHTNTSLTQQWLEEAQQTAGNTGYAGKRHQQRANWSEPLEVSYAAASGKYKTVYATARDICATGIGFECREAIPVYTEVLICRSGQIEGVRAMTLHCTRSLSRFIIGCRSSAPTTTAGSAKIAKAG